MIKSLQLLTHDLSGDRYDPEPRSRSTFQDDSKKKYTDDDNTTPKPYRDEESPQEK